MPDLQLTIRCGLAHALLRQRLSGPFAHIPTASDFGLSMKNAIEVDVPDSVARYQEFHADWDNKVREYARQIRAIKPDLVLANISYLALAAAQNAQIPALAMCSLNWMDIFFPYVPSSPAMSKIHAQMLDAYNSPTAFLRLTPGMPMPEIKHLRDIAPIASRGTAQPEELRAALGLASTQRLILFAMGGISMRLPGSWPVLPGCTWIVPGAAALLREDMIPLDSIGMDFHDVLASCDCVFTKSAYGVFAEATVCGTPVLYVERPDWPEEPCLVAWLKQHNLAHGITRAQFEQGTFGHALSALLQQPRATPLRASGSVEAAAFIQSQLEQSL